MTDAPAALAPSRLVVQAEALAWMAATPPPTGASVITSLPDISEVAPHTMEVWRPWFEAAAQAVMRWVPDAGVAIFYQSDVRYDAVWIDKGYLVMRAAESVGAAVLFHKIVCRKAPGTATLGRPSYAHMIAVSRGAPSAPRHAAPDVLPDAGAMSWSRAMGVTACEVACDYLRDETATRVVVDPCCGRGTALAVANAWGFDAIGVDLGARRCRAARAMTHSAGRR